MLQEDRTTNDYNYENAGFDAFLSRSIDDTPTGAGQPNVGLEGQSYQTSEMNYDAAQLSGAAGSVVRFGNIQLDGVLGRISIIDENGNEVLRLGDLDG